jgi:hypothetical protein
MAQDNLNIQDKCSFQITRKKELEHNLELKQDIFVYIMIPGRKEKGKVNEQENDSRS